MILRLFSEHTDINECSAETCGTDSQCQNYHGGFDCECKDPGHFKVNANENCKRKFCLIFRTRLIFCLLTAIIQEASSGGATAAGPVDISIAHGWPWGERQRWTRVFWLMSPSRHLRFHQPDDPNGEVESCQCYVGKNYGKIYT